MRKIIGTILIVLGGLLFIMQTLGVVLWKMEMQPDHEAIDLKQVVISSVIITVIAVILVFGGYKVYKKSKNKT
jgi:magnesium-transporting ATPase (P-type)